VPATAVCPVISGFDPLSQHFLRDPFSTAASWREDAPVLYSPELDLYFVTRFEDIEQIFLDRDTFLAANAQKPLWAPVAEAATILAEGVRRVPTLTNADPPRHPKMRTAVLKCLTPRRLAALEPGLRAYARETIEAMVARPVADVVTDLAFPLPAHAGFRLLGFPDADHQQLKSWSHDRVLLNYGRPGRDKQVEIATNVVAFWNYVRDFVATRQADRQDDFTSDLLAYQELNPGELTVLDVTSIVYSIALAGHESTTNGIANGLLHLLREPGQWDALVADRSHIPNAVEEMLRFDAPIIGWRRITSRAVDVGGVSLPEGAELFLLLAAGHHDGRKFPQPDVFDVRRDNARSHLAFGKGVHLCVGAPLARMEMRIALELLLELAPGLRLVDGQPLDYSSNMVFHTLERLLVETGGAERTPADAPALVSPHTSGIDDSAEVDESPRIDEARFQDVQRVISEAALTGRPTMGQRCSGCHFYLESADPMAFCWHERVQLLVGEDWWCHFWAERDDA
jgi:cytochrome P450